jgi:type IV pilus assembly protein PilA
MAVARTKHQGGFTLIELMITVAIVGVLAAVAIGQYRDYLRRAKLSEVMMAIHQCKTAVTEGYLMLQQAPQPGQWGCETQNPTTSHVAAVKTSADGLIRVTIANLDAAVNGQHVYLIPIKDDSNVMRTPADLGNKVTEWQCGSDFAVVRNALPSNCRTDTTPYAAATFE